MNIAVVAIVAIVVVFICLFAIQMPWVIVVAALPSHLGNVFLAKTSVYRVSRDNSTCGAAVEGSIEANKSCTNSIFAKYGRMRLKYDEPHRNGLQSNIFFVHISITPRQPLLYQFHLPNSQLQINPNPSVDIPFDTNNNKNINSNDKFVQFAYK